MTIYKNGPGNVPRLPRAVVDTLINSAGVSRLAYDDKDQNAQVHNLVHDTCEELLARLPTSQPAVAAGDVKTYRIPFSRIRATWLRRALMLMAYPGMVACNWLLILWAATKTLLTLPLVVLLKVLAAPFQMLGEGFTEAWRGRGPGSNSAAVNGSGDPEAGAAS
mgnify:CR=1 FL=1